jgi:hypothetical protein
MMHPYLGLTHDETSGSHICKRNNRIRVLIQLTNVGNNIINLINSSCHCVHSGMHIKAAPDLGDFDLDRGDLLRALAVRGQEPESARNITPNKHFDTNMRA